MDMTLVDAIRRLGDLESRCYSGHAVAYYEDGEAIGVVLKELRSAILCPTCKGSGKQFYALAGIWTCERCKEGGKRR